MQTTTDDKPCYEINPILWLEWHQDVRSCIVGVLLVVGSLMGLSLLLLSAYRDPPWPLVVLPAFLFCLFAFLFVPASAALKLARQQIDEHLFLHTTMSGHDILYGKLYRSLYLLVCLYGPLIPGLLLCAGLGRPELIGLCLICTIISVSLNLVTLGFMAGATTTPRAVLLGVLLAVCLVSALAMVSGIISSIENVLLSFRNYRWAFEPIWYAAFSTLFFVLLIAFNVFRMGVRLMEPRRSPIFVTGIGLTLLIGLTPFWIALLMNMYFFEEKFIFIVSSALFFGSPLVAVGTVQQLRRRTASKLGFMCQ